MIYHACDTAVVVEGLADEDGTVIDNATITGYLLDGETTLHTFPLTHESSGTYRGVITAQVTSGLTLAGLGDNNYQIKVVISVGGRVVDTRVEQTQSRISGVLNGVVISK